VKFISVFAGVGLLAVVGLWVGRRFADRPRHDPGVEGNARLIAYASVALVVPLAPEVITGIRPGLLAHALIGFFLVPLVLLKLGSVGYRFARYYAGDPQYRLAGPPELVMRLLAPILVLVTVALFATGIELWVFGFRFGEQWLTWHKAVFVLWFLATMFHVLAYAGRASQLAIADSGDRLRGALTRRSVIVGSLVLGAALVLAMLPFPSPFTLPTGAG
jgi:hypothetical protein